MYRIISLIIIMFLSSETTFCQQDKLTADSQLNRIIHEIKNEVGCDDSTAFSIILLINNVIEEIQTDLTYIATSNDDLSKKEIFINETIDKHFESPNSIVNVSSLSRNQIKKIPIRAYLIRLARLNQYRYSQVDLLFNQNYLGLGSIKKIGDLKYEFIVSMWQIFKGFVDEQNIYEDATKSNIRLTLQLQKNQISIKASDIIVAETTSLENYRNIIQQKP